MTTVRREETSEKMDAGIDLTLDSPDEDVLDRTLSASLNEETDPLMPILESMMSMDSENNNENVRNEELKSRLTNALNKLEELEKSDTEVFLDNSITKTKEESSGKLESQVEDHFKTILSAAEDYILKLEDQLEDLDIADKEIMNSTNRVMQEIDNTYQELMNKVCRAINKKRNLMRLEAEVYKTESLGPLKACRQQVNAQIKSSRSFVNELSQALVNSSIGKPQENKIIEASSRLGRIPAVPQPEELPYVRFSPPSKNVIDAVLTQISDLGTVLRMGPAQITDIEEKPGSLLVTWQIADPEYTTEEQIFVLQKADGEIYDATSEAFQTVYEGSEATCFVKDLKVGNPVTLRVGLQCMETAWSIHRFATTNIPHYSWATDNKDYMVTNNGKVVTKITDRISTLFSKIPQVDANQIIEFKFLDVSQNGKDNEGIALTHDALSEDDDLKGCKSLMITTLGKIFMDGEEKLMRLPKIRLGTQIIFTIERKDEETLRINIESSEKAVTYDWTVQTPLYFAARFRDFNKWNLMVK